MARTNLIGYTAPQLERLMSDLGEQTYRGRQVFKWLYKTRQYDFDLMSDLTKKLREDLSRDYEFTVPTAEKTLVSKDGTRKFLFRLHDGHAIETVLIPGEDNDRRTVCVSSQAGCALGCRFCATGAMGFSRDLTVGEIVGQLLYLRDELGEDAFTNIVFMGMGEPLLNYDNVIRAIGIVSDPAGMSHAAKKVTISTAGIVPAIRKLADDGCKARLAVSLNAATQQKREQIMPVTRKYSLEALTEVLKYYTKTTHWRVTFEYALFKDFNDSMDDVLALTNLVKGIPCKINLLAYNPVDGLKFQRPSDDKVNWFAKQLYPRVPAVTVRKSRGQDIAAACGQLAGENAKPEVNEDV